MSKERWQLVYVGFHFEPYNGDRHHLYRQIQEDNSLSADIPFKKELLPANPGAILEVDVEIGEDGSRSVYARDRTYTGKTWTEVDPAAVVGWAAMDRASTTTAQAARKSRVDEFERNLQPLRIAYWTLSGPQRAILLAQIVQFITAHRVE